MKSQIFFATLLTLGVGCAASQPPPENLDIAIENKPAAPAAATSPEPQPAATPPVAAEKPRTDVQAKSQEVIDWQKFFQPPPSKEEKRLLEKKLAEWSAEASPDILLKKARNEMALGLIKNAELTYRQLLRLEGDHLEALIELSQTYLKQRTYDKSLELLVQARSVLGQNPNADAAQRFKYKYVLALNLLARQEKKQGRAILSDLIAHDPQFTPGYAALASSYIRDGKLDIAEFITKRGLDRGKEDSRLTNILGVIAQERGDFIEAKRWLDKTLTLSPTYPPALINRANLAIARGEYEAAEMDLQKALAFAPENEEAFTTLGILQMRTGRPDDSRASFTKSLDLNPENAYARYNLGLLMAQHFAKPSVALRLFHEVLQTKDANAQIKNLAVMHIESMKEESSLD